MPDNDQDHVDWRVRVETKIDLLVARISTVERKASFYGLLGGILVSIASKFTGCG